ncbi:sensor histidine kinase [Pseudonocardia sp. CA-107938]|uniref:sensor histidine kinase n=1 Tax=Pseudonocardia sp. CA-107938 TaxID=3240021 RepID=UPI003D93325B
MDGADAGATVVVGPRARPGRYGPALVGGAGVGVAASVLAWWFRWGGEPVVGLLNLLVVTSFAMTAAVLAADPEQRTTAREMGGAAFCYILSWGWTWPPWWQQSPLPMLSFVGGYVWFVLLGTALTRYPNERLQRDERRLLWSFALWVVGLKLVLAVVSRPEWARFDAAAWWPALAPSRGFYDGLTSVFHVGLVCFVLALLAVLVRKIRRGIFVDRVDALPAVVAAASIALAGVAYLVARVLDSAPAVQDLLRVGTAITALGTPLSFVVVILHRHLVTATAAAAMPRIYRARTPVELRAELRGTLGDPELELWRWDPETGGHRDVDGTPVEPDRDGRYLVTVRSTDGEPLATLGMRPSLRRHGRLVDVVVSAAGIAVEREAGIAEARAAARRAMARDMHDGAQQALLSAMLRLAIARNRADDGVGAAIDEARTGVDAALAQIRGLVQEPAPGEADLDLAAAVGELAAQSEVPVELDVRGPALPDALARQVWFVVAEALTNVRRHSGAAGAAVSVVRLADQVVVRIADDGRGGADPSAGRGLAGIVERVEGWGGTVEVESPVGGGTTITARFPCG